MSLHPTFVEYMDGARLYLETETDKDNASIREVKIHFCDFIRIMIKNFSRKYIFLYALFIYFLCLYKVCVSVANSLSTCIYAIAMQIPIQLFKAFIHFEECTSIYKYKYISI